MKQTVQNTLQEHRRRRGDTQETLAHSVGVTRQTIIAIEKGKYTPSVALALRLAAYFGVPVENIFTLTT